MPKATSEASLALTATRRAASRGAVPRRFGKNATYSCFRRTIGIWCYSFETWGEAQADRYLGALEEGMTKLAAEPESGKSRDSLRAGYWSVRIERHVVFYTFSEHEVRLRRVLHDSMDVDRHLP